MAMNYEELDQETRARMLAEFELEESENPYRSKTLSPLGRQAFPGLMRDAIEGGDEVSLFTELFDERFWNREEEYERGGVVRTRRVNVEQAAQRLALTEFSTWYVRGFSKRLMEEGEEVCEVYRGAQPKWEPAACAEHEGLVIDVRKVYDGHRAKYWPEPGNPRAFSIPFGPGCHHVIRRIAR